MNRIEFYTKLNKAKDEVRKKQLEHSSTQNNYNSWFIKVDDYYGINQPRYFTKEEFDELRHSNEYGKQHYAKIENYYPDGRTRYFWSKDEWDNYQKIKQSIGNREAAERSATNKTVENNQKEKEEWDKKKYNFTQTTDNLKKRQDQREAQRRRNATAGRHLREDIEAEKKEEWNKKKYNFNQTVNDLKETQDKIEKQKRQNEAAAKALEKAEKEKWDTLKKQNNPEPKFVSTAETREEAEIEARNKTIENNRKEKLEKDFENWKKEGEKNILPSRKKLNKYTEELTKLQGQMNLIQNRKFSQEGDKQKYNELKKAINEKEQQIEKAKESLAKEREANYKKNMASQEKAMKEGQKTTIEENKKLRESIEKQKAEELENWKKEKKAEVGNEMTAITRALSKAADGSEKFNIDNPYVDLLKEMLSEVDPEFDGDINNYVKNAPLHGILTNLGKLVGSAAEPLKALDNKVFGQEKHTDNVAEAIRKLSRAIIDDIDSTTYEDEKYDSYLNKLKKAKKEKTDKAITKDISNARLSLKKMYDGDSKNLDLDPSLMKALNDKLAQMDEEYNGNLYKYVRPYLFNTWIKDDDSYDTVKKALDEIEKELRTANKNNEDYGEYIDKVSKILEA